MRIVRRPEFLAMPDGTIYEYYWPNMTDGGLRMKHDTMRNDFIVQDISGIGVLASESSDDLHGRLDLMLSDGISCPVDLDCASRDGCFDEGQLFLIWERADVIALIAKLQGVL